MSTTASVPEQLHEALAHELLRLAQQEEDVAANEAGRVHYWEALPVTVAIHRHCATALRSAADELLAGRHPDPSGE
jgi:hypothetical protein